MVLAIRFFTIFPLMATPGDSIIAMGRGKQSIQAISCLVCREAFQGSEPALQG